MVASRLLLISGLAVFAAALKVAPDEFQRKMKTQEPHTFNVNTAPKMKESTCPRMVEKLRNDGNGAAYMGSMHIGGNQMDSVIWDTGSDQQVVNSMRTMNFVSPCMALPDAPKRCYNAWASPGYEMLDIIPKEIEYGSGGTMVLAGADTIGLKGGHCMVEHMPFYELMATEIGQILTHDLDVVAGLAPNQFTGTQLVKEMKMDRFSFCFNKDTSKDGFLVWQDNEPADQQGFHFFSAPVSGAANYWSVEVNDLELKDQDDHKKSLIGCAEGCTAIVDTGTSLLTLDDGTLKNLEDYLEEYSEGKQLDCTPETLAKFPTLNMKMDGNDFYLHPEDYIMYTEVEEDRLHQKFKDSREYLSTNFPKLANLFAKRSTTTKKECVLMFTEPIAPNVMILGMPTFRNYYVTFDRWHHRINFARHNGNCKPEGLNFKQQRSKAQRLQRIDLDKIHYSNAYHTLYKKNLQLKQQKAEKALAMKQQSQKK